MAAHLSHMVCDKEFTAALVFRFHRLSYVMIWDTNEQQNSLPRESVTWSNLLQL